MSTFLLEFFVDSGEEQKRPLTNSNVVLDFFRYKEARYYSVITRYLKSRALPIPDYERQYRELMECVLRPGRRWRGCLGLYISRVG